MIANMQKKLILAQLVVMASLTFVPSEAANESSSKRSSSTGSEIERSEGLLRTVMAKGNDKDISDALYDTADVCFNHGDIALAEKYMIEALKYENRVTRPHSAEQKTKMHISLAIMHVAQKKTDNALLDYQNALTIAESAKLADYVSSILNSKGALLLQLGKLDEAESYFEKAISSSASAKYRARLVTALINKAILLRTRGRNEQALESLNEAVRVHQGKKDLTLAHAYYNIGAIHGELGHAEEAVISYKKALDVFKSYKDPMMEEKACYAIAVNLRYLEKQAESDKYFQQAAAFNRVKSQSK